MENKIYEDDDLFLEDPDLKHKKARKKWVATISILSAGAAIILALGIWLLVDYVIPKSYNINFIGSDGTTYTERYKAGGVSLEPLLKTGYSFEGWFKDSKYQMPFTAEDELNSDLTLYGLLVPNVYSITFNTNGGDVLPETIEVTYDTTFEIPDVRPKKDNYSFVGWAYDISETSEDKIFTFGQSLAVPPNDATLFAIYLGDIVTVMFEYDEVAINGVLLENKQIEVRYGSEFETVKENMHNINYNKYLLGFAAKGLINPFVFSGKITPDAFDTNLFENRIITLVPVWKDVEVYVSYDLNGAEGTPPPAVNYISGYEFELPNAPHREGFRFLGWSLDLTAERILTDNKFTANEDNNILYAIWEEII